jgi:hypothetical protein
VRDTYDPDPLKETFNKMIAKIPVASYFLPEKITTTGEVKKRSGGTVDHIIQAWLAPQYYATESTDPVNSEIFRLYELGYTDQILPRADKTLSWTQNGKEVNYRLSADEYHEYQKMLGKACYTEVLEFINSDSYVDLTNEKRVEKIKSKVDAKQKSTKSAYIKELKKRMEGGN